MRRRYGEVVAGVALLLAGILLLEYSLLFGLLLLFAGLALICYQIAQTRARLPASRHADYATPRRARTPADTDSLLTMLMDALQAGSRRRSSRVQDVEESVRASASKADTAYQTRVAEPPAPPDSAAYPHALDSMRNAGLDPETTPVQVTDIGLIAYEDASALRVLHRTHPVSTALVALQPFIELRLPTAAVGRVRFELRDGDGRPAFVYENEYQLAAGKNLIVPDQRLRVGERRGNWTLTVKTDDVWIAEYPFGWTDEAAQQERIPHTQRLADDGELPQEAQILLRDDPRPRMTLDELLGEPVQTRGRR